MLLKEGAVCGANFRNWFEHFDGRSKVVASSMWHAGKNHMREKIISPSSVSPSYVDNG